MVTSLPREPSPDPSLDPFERFAAECGLHMRAEALYAAPRDVLHPPAESDQHYHVTLWRDGGSAVQLVYDVPLTDPRPPRIHDVLWWVAGDAWAIERTGRRIDRWAADYDYPVGDAATARLFACHTALADAMMVLLGEDAYRRLLTLYTAEIAPDRPRAS